MLSMSHTFGDDIERITFGALSYNVFSMGVTNLIDSVADLAQNIFTNGFERFDTEAKRRLSSERRSRTSYFFSSSMCSVCFCMPARIMIA